MLTVTRTSDEVRYCYDAQDQLTGIARLQRSDGSWPCYAGPGEAFATAVATLVLQIPYHYLPIFQR